MGIVASSFTSISRTTRPPGPPKEHATANRWPKTRTAQAITSCAAASSDVRAMRSIAGPVSIFLSPYKTTGPAFFVLRGQCSGAFGELLFTEGSPKHASVHGKAQTHARDCHGEPAEPSPSVVE